MRLRKVQVGCKFHSHFYHWNKWWKWETFFPLAHYPPVSSKQTCPPWKYIVNMFKQADMLTYGSVDFLMDLNSKLLPHHRELLNNPEQHTRLVGKSSDLIVTQLDMHMLSDWWVNCYLLHGQIIGILLFGGFVAQERTLIFRLQDRHITSFLDAY